MQPREWPAQEIAFLFQSLPALLRAEEELRAQGFDTRTLLEGLLKDLPGRIGGWPDTGSPGPATE
jgi:hypothetical protein